MVVSEYTRPSNFFSLENVRAVTDIKSGRSVTLGVNSMTIVN